MKKVNSRTKLNTPPLHGTGESFKAAQSADDNCYGIANCPLQDDGDTGVLMDHPWPLLTPIKRYCRRWIMLIPPLHGVHTSVPIWLRTHDFQLWVIPFT